MKKQPTVYLRAILTILFFLGLSNFINASSSEGTGSKTTKTYPLSYFGQTVTWGTSTAKVFGVDKVTTINFKNPVTNKSQGTQAGTFRGEVDGQNANFYCIDIAHNVVWYTESQPHTYTDEGPTDPKITYILNNYYPYLPYPYTGAASTVQLEAAAVQVAIWHFSDNLDANTVDKEAVRERALEIISNTEQNYNTFYALETLLLIPTNQSVPAGSSGSFTISTFDENGNPLSGIPVSLSSTTGTLSSTAITTSASGSFGPVTITQGSSANSVITAEANVKIPLGTKYFHKVEPNVHQKLVLATPAGLTRRVTANVEWYTPQDCDTRGYTTYTQGGWGSKPNSGPGKVRELYFSSVFPNGLTVGSNYKIKLTSSAAVQAFLPQGGTAAALTQNYTNPTNSISVLAGQLVALTLNVEFSSAGYLGTNTTPLGSLEIVSGPFAGMTVADFLVLANKALGGESTSYSLSDFNDAATSINENFDNGKKDEGYLTCHHETCYSTIGDYVWHDANANGIQDNNELGIEDIVVELYDSSNNLISSTTTDNNGHYEFTNLLNGTYKVKVADVNFEVGNPLYSNTKTKWYATSKNTGSDDTKDSDANINEKATVNVNCANDYTVDFGFYKTCVSITKTADKQSVNAGETITYTFTVENCGDITLGGGVDVYDAMINPAGNHKINNISPVNPGQIVSFTREYTTTSNDCGTLVNTATAIGHPVNGTDAVEDESSVSVDVICGNQNQDEYADLSIEKTVDNANPQCGDPLVFTITVTNNGPSTAKDVKVSDVLPAGLDYTASSPSQGSYDESTGLWNIGNIASGENVTMTISANVDCTQLNNSTFDLGAAKDYNLFVIYDLDQPSSDTQGKIAVGRNASLANYSVGDLLPANSGDVLVVGKNLTYTSGAVSNGNVVYGNTSNLPTSTVSVTGGTVRKDNVIDFTAAKGYLQNLSTTLSNYTANGNVTFQWGGLTLTGTDPFLNVFKVNGADLSAANNVMIDAPNGSVVVVNINGTDVTWTGGLNVTGTSITNVLYNFYKAKTLKIQGINVTGSILAPFADVNFVTGVINGQFICKSMTGMGQFNLAQFIGNIPGEKSITNAASIASSTTVDPDGDNNTASATVKIGGTQDNGGNDNGGSGNNGGSGSNGSGTWEQTCSFSAGEIVYSLAYGSNNTIYAGTWGGKIYKSTDNGTSWTRINNSMNVGFIWALNISNGTIFAATEQGVYKYNGSTWTLTGLTGKDTHALTSYGGTLYAGTWGFGVFKSTDNGTTWTEINNGLGYILSIQALTVTQNGEVFTGSFGSGVFKYNSATNTWTKQSCSYSFVWALASSSTALYAGMYGDGAYRSLDGGATFTKLNLNAQFIYNITVAGSKVFVSSFANGVYVSEDNGETWSSLGMGGYGVSSIMFNPNTSEVLAGTKEGKIFVMSSINGGSDGLTATEENGIPTEFELSQNYPNPFNPSTTIRFALPQSGNFTLKVYNMLGQEIATLIDGSMNAGMHNVSFNANGLASGLYIYRLAGDNVNITKKMILMK